MQIVNSKERIVICPNRAKAIGEQKTSVSGDLSSLVGVCFTTLEDLVADLWDLYGDGRSIVTDAQRQMIIARLIDKFEIDKSIGTVRELSNFIKCNSKRIDLFCVEDINGDLSNRERSVIALAKGCLEQEAELGLVEVGLTESAILDGLRALDIIKVDDFVIDEPYQDILCEFIEENKRDNEHGQTNVRFLVPAGPTMTSSMIAESVIEAIDIARRGHQSYKICLCAPDPYALLDDISHLLDLDDLRVVIKDAIPFSQTSLGRFLHSIEALCEDDACSVWIDCATDIALSPYSKIAPFSMSEIKNGGGVTFDSPEKLNQKTFKAKDLNSIWRQNRTYSAADAKYMLSRLSSTVKSVMELLESKNVSFFMTDKSQYDSLLAAFETCARSAFDPFDRERELSAVAKFSDILTSAQGIHVPTKTAVDIMLKSSVSVTVANKACSDFTLEIISIDTMDQMTKHCVNDVYICNATDAYLNSRDMTASLDRIASLIGFAGQKTNIDQVNNRFLSALNAAENEIVFVFPLTDDSAKESYASFVVDNYLESRFGVGAVMASIVSDRRPEGFDVQKWHDIQMSVARRGEESVAFGVGRKYKDDPVCRNLPLAHRGKLSGSCIKALNTYLEGGDGGIVLSPSSIEAYMSCPYKWFIERKLRIANIDESLGPLEKGSFVHLVLQDFYSKVIAMGGRNYLDELSENALEELFSESFDGVLQGQRDLSPGSGRYVPINNLEMIETTRLKNAVYRSILLWKNLPKSFSPSSLEHRIDPFTDKDPVKYGGAYIKGVIDRIDEGPDKQFYILDYKGNIKDHDAGIEKFEYSECVDALDDQASPDGKKTVFNSQIYPDHVQTLIYASAELKRRYRHGVTSKCVGAMYTSYRSTSASGLVVGSYDCRNSEIAKISNSKSSVDIEFQEFLNAVESLVSKHISSLEDGCIHIAPSDENACKYCIYESCEGRRV